MVQVSRMESINTHPFKLSKKEHFKILTVKYFKQKWWLFMWLLLLLIFTLTKDDKESFDYFLLIIGLGFPLYVLIFFWRFSYSKQNKIFLLGRHYQFDNDLLKAFLEDGTESTIRLEHFIKIYKTKEYALLYLAKASFIYLPKNIFSTEEDYYSVLNLIESKIRNQKLFQSKD